MRAADTMQTGKETIEEAHMYTMARMTGVAARGTMLVLLAAAATMGCGVSKSKYMDVTKSRDELAAQNKQLQGTLDSTNKDKAQIESDKAALEGRVKEMEAATQEANAKLAQEQKAAADLKATYEGMVGHLQTEVSSGKMQIEQMRDGISVSLAQDILFRSGSADLDKTGRTLLLKLAEDLKASPFQVIVTGHTDNQKIGAALASRYPSNWELGGARAARIVRLFEEAGITKDRLGAVSFADSRPRESNDTPEGRAKNRRIEIRLRPVSSEQTAGN